MIIPGYDSISYFITAKAINQLESTANQCTVTTTNLEDCWYYNDARQKLDKLAADGYVVAESIEYYGLWLVYMDVVVGKIVPLLQVYHFTQSVATIAVSTYCLYKMYKSSTLTDYSYVKVSQGEYNTQSNQLVSDIINKAKTDQTSGGYNADSFDVTLLKKGTKVYGLRGDSGTPGQTAWYTTKEMVEKSGYNAVTLNEGLQVYKSSQYGYRKNIGTYELSRDIVVPTGKALNNVEYGAGGYTQFYIEDYSSVLKFISESPLN